MNSMGQTGFRRIVLGAALTAGAAFTGNASASVMHLRDAAAAEASRVQQFTFEGSSPANSVGGGLAISQATYGTGTGVSYVAGFDGSSLALKPQVLETGGAGLKSSATMSFARTMTVEALVRVDGDTIGTANQYIVAGPPNPSRGFFLMYRQGDIKTGIGSTTLADGSALRDVLSNANAEPTLGDWLYVATTYTATTSPNQTVVNAYVANLTAGETTLTRTLADVVIAESHGASSTLGVGMFSGTAGEAFNGAIDELTIYNTVLSQTALQSHLNAVYVPEPTGLAALGAIGAGGLLRRRRR